MIKSNMNSQGPTGKYLSVIFPSPAPPPLPELVWHEYKSRVFKYVYLMVRSISLLYNFLFYFGSLHFAVRNCIFGEKGWPRPGRMIELDTRKKCNPET